MPDSIASEKGGIEKQPHNSSLDMLMFFNKKLDIWTWGRASERDVHLSSSMYLDE